MTLEMQLNAFNTKNIVPPTAGSATRNFYTSENNNLQLMLKVVQQFPTNREELILGTKKSISQ